ncbi:hypothetical protein A2773_02905 [Candidatus Gottesmanbacteria bacterium RIFCSPHIGHO2_01_FULL_39_10]|uniref:Peptidase A2 domain-containing protein n=1 Tax=Candidatus Gottesmanbacteria bacterium RIFCSPHIGHO2_01_FULL_39_10 TaxID=1798375 RepID=A0A1F5ZQH3_9BACT|nr:MAG: hypothetical protein A2773_02905 [Candidatus Gottesmanbacteria bacterium RIFCSPHIGHO2_01_FULL_39_10]
MIIFKYKEESLGVGRGTVRRPVADVFLKTQSGSYIEFHPYIDSGADLTLIPLSLGKLLGLHIDEKHMEQIGGIKGSVPIIQTECQMRIGQEDLKAKIAWALIEDVPPVLGRTDIFDRFNVTFKQKEGIIKFEKS